MIASRSSISGDAVLSRFSIVEINLPMARASCFACRIAERVRKAGTTDRSKAISARIADGMSVGRKPSRQGFKTVAMSRTI